MAIQDKRNHITIAKAIGIILMVAGHSGIPSKMANDYIYIFHMPLFFFCSGYFFNEIIDIHAFRHFCMKRIVGLYIPYLKWSISFLLLHNLFYYFHLYSNSFNLSDYFWWCLRIASMTEYEALLRPFWFLKLLLLSSICVGLISYLRNTNIPNYSNILLALLFFILTLSLKIINIHVPIIGDPSIITFGALYILTGFIYRKYEKNIQINHFFTILMFFIILLGINWFHGNIDMRYTTVLNTPPYYVLSIMGIFIVLEISTRMNNNKSTKVNRILYYIGNHTMPILALHLLALKFGNYVKLHIYNLPIDRLSDHTIITDYNDYFWFIYTILGIICPLLFTYVLSNIITTRKNTTNIDNASNK